MNGYGWTLLSALVGLFFFAGAGCERSGSPPPRAGVELGGETGAAVPITIAAYDKSIIGPAAAQVIQESDDEANDDADEAEPGDDSLDENADERDAENGDAEDLNANEDDAERDSNAGDAGDRDASEDDADRSLDENEQEGDAEARRTEANRRREEARSKKRAADAPRVEEQFGFTTQGVQ